MSQATPTNVLITGANRGIGRALVDTYLLRPNYTLICLVRGPHNESSQSLLTQRRAENSRSIIIPYDATSPASAEDALNVLTNNHPEIKHLDLVIANAGFASYFGSSLTCPLKTLTAHYQVNALAPLTLFRTFLPHLHSAPSSSPNHPEIRGKFIAISSQVGSTTSISAPQMRVGTDGKPRTGALAYGHSKAALNHIMVRLDAEVPGVVVGVFTPGPTKTGFGDGNVNWDAVPGVMELEVVIEGLVRQFDGCRKVGSGDGGAEERLVLKDWRGREIPW